MKSQKRDEFQKIILNAAKTQNEGRKLYVEFGSKRPSEWFLSSGGVAAKFYGVKSGWNK